MRYHLGMSHAMTVRLDDETARQLSELAEHMPSRAAAVVAAIHEAWRHLQEQKLEQAYAAAVAENPNYPFESSEERATIRRRRNSREART
jgi:antitoxin MazE4